MTVQELIEKLQSLNPNDEVIIEGNHGEYDHISATRIDEQMMHDFDGHLHHAVEDDPDAPPAKKMVVIQL